MKRARAHILYGSKLLFHKKCGSPLYDRDDWDGLTKLAYCKTCNRTYDRDGPSCTTTKPKKSKKKGGAKSRRAYISKDTKIRVVERQKEKCASCGKKLKIGGYHIDHKRAIALGGSNSIRNLQALCPNCHDRKNKADRRKIARKR